MPEVTVKVPSRLVSTGGRVAFSIEIEGNEYREWNRTCRIGSLAEGTFTALSMVQMVLEGDIGGELVAVLEFTDEGRGRRLTGAFRLQIDRRESNSQNVVVGNQHTEGAGVIYQPIEVKGAEAKEVRLVGDKALIPVPLEEERPGTSVPLEELLERETFIALPEIPGRPVRVFQLRVDKNLVLGRCYANQLSGKAQEALERIVNPPRVHWVTTWDDDRVNRISALLGLGSRGAQDLLLVRNITDYSRQGTPLALVCDDEPEVIVKPGGVHHVELEPEQEISICVGEGTTRRTLARLSFQETLLETTSGQVPVPVLQTVNTSFPFPPDGGDNTVRVHFLGVWLAVTPKRLRELLQGGGGDLQVEFWQDDFRLRFSSDHRAVVVGSNVDLRMCMAG